MEEPPGEVEGPKFVRATVVPRDGARRHREISGTVGFRRHAQPAELVADRVLRLLRQGTLQERVQGDEVRGVVQIDFVVDPVDQFGGVVQAGDIVRVGLVAIARARLYRALMGVAERVVVHAVALPGHLPVERPQGHAGGARRVHHHADAAARPSKAPESQEFAVEVLAGQVGVARRPREAGGQLESGLPSPEGLEWPLDGAGDPLGAGVPAQLPLGAGVADQAAKEVPVVLQARLIAGKPGALPVAAAEHLPTRVLGLDHLSSVVGRDGRVGGCGNPVGRARLGPQGFQMVAGTFTEAAIQLGEGPDLPGGVGQVVKRPVVEATGFGRFQEAPESLALRVHEDAPPAAVVGVGERRNELLLRLVPRQPGEEEGARVPGIRPASAPAHEFAHGPVPLLGREFLRREHFRGDDRVRALAQTPAPNGPGARFPRRREVLVSTGNLEALEVTTGQEVHHARHRVGTVDGRRPLLDHLDPVESDRRKRVHIDEAASGKTDRDVYLAAAVQKHERARGAESPEVDGGNGLRHQAWRPGAVPALTGTENPLARRKIAEEVERLGRTQFGQGPAARNRHCVGKFDGRFLKGRPGNHQFVKVENLRLQPQFHEHAPTFGHRDVLREGLVPQHLDSDFMRARGNVRNDEAAPVLRHHDPSHLWQLDPRACDGIGRRGVLHDPGDGARRLRSEGARKRATNQKSKNEQRNGGLREQSSHRSHLPSERHAWSSRRARPRSGRHAKQRGVYPLKRRCSDDKVNTRLTMSRTLHRPRAARIVATLRTESLSGARWRARGSRHDRESPARAIDRPKTARLPSRHRPHGPVGSRRRNCRRLPRFPPPRVSSCGPTSFATFASSPTSITASPRWPTGFWKPPPPWTTVR